ncbi:hypothetical protein Sjap_012728 [Stephania japonica]|uniref:Uncharacterized protein n=1 Tax=Stephania japonica TaxID=461633 RepID=A0AAP0IWL1_9MAGN
MSSPPSSSDPPPTSTSRQSQGQSKGGGGGGGGVLYPVASSGRPFIPPKFFRHHPPPTSWSPSPTPPPPPPPSALPPPNPNCLLLLVSRSTDFLPTPPLLHHPSSSSSSRPFPGVAAALGNSKGAPFPSPSSEFNGLRELNRDDTVVAVQDRKVRFSDGTSLYSLCRSWVRNGLPKEPQTNIGNGVKLLPRPLPTATDTGTPEKSESGDEDGDKDKEEDEGSVEHLSSHELLQRHIKRAKRVRARLRKERLQRIGRYKQRLALLLPSSAEHFRSDAAPGS